MTLYADQVQHGPPIRPEDRVKLYSPDEWEAFIKEWLSGLEKEYEVVEKLGGAGDKGRDIVATRDKAKGRWDNYQCKHYNNSLMPTDIWSEIGKLIFYTHRKDYTIPVNYYFVSPQDVGSSLRDLLLDKTKLKSELFGNWGKYCQKAITKKIPVLLEGDFLTYAESFPYQIIAYKPLSDIIKQHRKTKYYVERFGGGLPDRKSPPAAPTAVEKEESKYIQHLVDAYADADGRIKGLADLSDKQFEAYQRHIKRSRNEFFSAEHLRVFSRENLSDGEVAFSKLLDEVYNGIVDIVDSNQHPNGFERVLKAVQGAKVLDLQSHPLHSRMFMDDRGGSCHHLANNDRLAWVRKK